MRINPNIPIGDALLVDKCKACGWNDPVFPEVVDVEEFRKELKERK